MKIYKLNEHAEIPQYATEGSACFDLKACLKGVESVRAYVPFNRESAKPVKIDGNGEPYVQIHPNFRYLIPTGLIFGIKNGYSMRIYARSGMAFKQGIVLANSVGVIDSDYVEETFVMLTNISDNVINIRHGDRVAQAELIKVFQEELEEGKRRPKRKTSRAGGFGSTGAK